MRSFAEIETAIDAITFPSAGAGGLKPTPDGAQAAAAELLRLGEESLEAWVVSRGEEPTEETREGFRILALHRQGAKGDPSFNACRETVRELVYHYNLITLDPAHPETDKRLALAGLVARHLAYFIGGKMEQAGLGEFCCSSKPLRASGG